MRVLVLLCCVLGVVVANLATAQPSPNDATVWYAITSGNGAQLGYASTEFVVRRDGRDVIETQALFLKEEGEPATNIVGRTVYAEDRSGRTVAIDATTQTGRFVSRTNVRIGGDVAH